MPTEKPLVTNSLLVQSSDIIVSTQNGLEGEWRRLVAIVELVLEFNLGRLWCVWRWGAHDDGDDRRKC